MKRWAAYPLRVLRQDRPKGERLAAYSLRVLGPLLLVLVLLGVALAGYWLKRPAEAVALSCPDPVAGCGFSHRAAPASVRFSSAPTPLEAFTLKVGAPGATMVHAKFQMVGMDMGFNRYDLRRNQNGKQNGEQNGEFAAQVTLPVCVSGRGDWMLYLEIDGMRYALPFSTR